MRALLAAVIIMAPLAVEAAPSPMALYRKGDWAGCAAAGRRQGDAAGYAVATRCGLVQAGWAARDRDEAVALVDAALRDSEAGLKLAPQDYLMRLAHASAVGFKAQLDGSRTLSARARDMILALTKAEPRRYEAWIAYGSWNGEVVLKAGKFLAGAAMGASRSKMEQAFASALARDPACPLPPAYRGLLLTRLGDEKGARPYLQQAASLKPRDAYEAMFRRDAITVDKLLAAGDVNAAKTIATRVAAFGHLSRDS